MAGKVHHHSTFGPNLSIVLVTEISNGGRFGCSETFGIPNHFQSKMPYTDERKTTRFVDFASGNQVPILASKSIGVEGVHGPWVEMNRSLALFLRKS